MDRWHDRRDDRHAGQPCTDQEVNQCPSTEFGSCLRTNPPPRGVYFTFLGARPVSGPICATESSYQEF
jgi:hypothetical protein